MPSFEALELFAYPSDGESLAMSCRPWLSLPVPVSSSDQPEPHLLRLRGDAGLTQTSSSWHEQVVMMQLQLSLRAAPPSQYRSLPVTVSPARRVEPDLLCFRTFVLPLGKLSTALADTPPSVFQVSESTGSPSDSQSLSGSSIGLEPVSKHAAIRPRRLMRHMPRNPAVSPDA